jgi:O-antigen/teichoic acid export membrane protein
MLLKVNMIANVVGKGWMALLALALIPYYMHLLGPESYGLVGFAATVQAACGLLDMGLSGTLNRELARLAHTEGSAHEMRNLVRTAESLYWPIALAIAFAGLIGSGLIAHRWLHLSHLNPMTAQHAIVLIGIVVALQFPQALYMAALAGVERQIGMNVALVIGMTFRGVLTILMLRALSSGVMTFFVAQIVGNVLLTLCLAVMLWLAIPPSPGRARFDRRLLFQLKGFIAGMAGIALLLAILLQMDNFAVSHLRPLAEFGYYSIATSVSCAPYVLSGAVNMAVLPRFTRYVAAGDYAELELLYHRGAQALTAVLLPVSVSLGLFAPELLLAWTGNPHTVAHTHLILSLMLIGVVLHALLYVPLALQVACGWPQFSAAAFSIGLVIFLPLTFFLTARFGSVGAPFGWMGLNATIIAVGIPLMHRRLLPGAQRSWYVNDVGIPALATLAAGTALRFAAPHGASRAACALIVLLALGVTGLAAAAATPLIRKMFATRLAMVRPRAG